MSTPLPVTPDDPIVALATPWGESALAVIRAVGTRTLDLAAVLFRGRRPLTALPDARVTHGHIVDPDRGAVVDEVIVWVSRAPGGYTGQDSLEVCCHGGGVVRRVLDLFLSHGFRAAGPGEFTLRAYLGGRMDLTRAEAVNELIRARGERARELALARLSGVLESRVESVRAKVVEQLARVEVALDYPEEEVDEPSVDAASLAASEGEIDALLATYATGRLVQEGARVVIAGRSNAGKSTLFNLLLREDRALVSPEPGTTRDYLEASVELRGYHLRLYDTAGLREDATGLEGEGIRRSHTLISSADLVLYVVDSSRGETGEDRDRLASLPPGRVLVVWSKTDLSAAGAVVPPGYVSCSGLTGDGLEGLHDEIERRLYGGRAGVREVAVVDSERQKRALERARAALTRAREALAASVPLDLVAVELREAADNLGEITGRVTTREILTEVFSRFCVGK